MWPSRFPLLEKKKLEGHALSLKCIGSEVIHVTSAHVLFDKASHLSLLPAKRAEKYERAHEICDFYYCLYLNIFGR